MWVCFWPFVQTLNFAFIAEKNRVVVVSIASFIWAVYLSYAHHHEGLNLSNILQRKLASKEPKDSSEQN